MQRAEKQSPEHCNIGQFNTVPSSAINRNLRVDSTLVKSDSGASNGKESSNGDLHCVWIKMLISRVSGKRRVEEELIRDVSR